MILYSPPKLGEAQYHLRSKYNWRSQYNSPKANITENDRFLSESVVFWQRMRDSNPRERSQSPVCYRYTNPLCVRHGYYYTERRKNVKNFFPIFPLFSPLILSCPKTHFLYLLPGKRFSLQNTFPQIGKGLLLPFFLEHGKNIPQFLPGLFIHQKSFTAFFKIGKC